MLHLRKKYARSLREARLGVGDGCQDIAVEEKEAVLCCAVMVTNGGVVRKREARMVWSGTCEDHDSFGSQGHVKTWKVGEVGLPSCIA